MATSLAVRNKQTRPKINPTAKAVRANRFSGSSQLENSSSSAVSPCIFPSVFLGPFNSQHLHLQSLHQFQLCFPVLDNLNSLKSCSQNHQQHSFTRENNQVPN